MSWRGVVLYAFFPACDSSFFHVIRGIIKVILEKATDRAQFPPIYNRVNESGANSIRKICMQV